MLFPGNYADSLEHLARAAPTDSIKARSCFLLAEYWCYTDTAKANQYLLAGERLIKASPYLKALHTFYKAFVLYDIDRQEAALKFLEAGQQLEKLPGREAMKFRARSWRNYGSLQQFKDNDLAMLDAMMNKALPIAQKANDTLLTGFIYADIGMIFMNQKLYTKAADFYRKSIQLLDLLPDKLYALLPALDNRALNFCYMDSLKQAASIINRVGSVLKSYPPSDYQLDLALTKGVYLRKSKNYHASIQVLRQAIQLADSLQNTALKFNLLIELHSTYMAMKHYPESLNILLDALKTDQYHYLDDRLQLAQKLTETYDRLNDVPNAYKWMKTYTQLQDSVYTRDFKNSISNMDTRFRLSEKEKQVALLQAANKEAALKAKNTRLSNSILIVLCLVILLAFGFFFITYRTGKKLALQKELNYQQQLKEMEQRQQIVTTEAMLEGEERERRRVARDLHDGLGGMLAGIKMKLSGHVKQLQYKEEKEQKELAGIISQLDNSVSELRRIARNMMPESLIRFGLQTALKDLCESMMSGDIRISFIAFDIDEQIDLSKQVVIYRIIQEILANAIRHSHARNIMVQCSQHSSRFYVTVEDDGIGFNKTTSGKKGIGLTNIENRVKYLNGTLDVVSAPDQGTTINMELHVAA
ncbi:histidine kinase [Niabella ginsenosidivorans]|uniref:Histidine kinase n=1 Tax=Niabella ginsenosidivorans TaxID=1176587 RepID=A0A1A9I848_9BACT|nr:histidine kinase [Niabella ginsenosidivorans]